MEASPSSPSTGTMRDGGTATDTTNGTRHAAPAGVDDDDGGDGGWCSGGTPGVALDVVDGSAGRSKPKEKDILYRRRTPACV